MQISTNKPGTKLTRPVAMWKRVLRFLAGLGCLLVAASAYGSDAGWVTLLPALFGLGAIVTAFEKTETIG